MLTRAESHQVSNETEPRTRPPAETTAPGLVLPPSRQKCGLIKQSIPVPGEERDVGWANRQRITEDQQPSWPLLSSCGIWSSYPPCERGLLLPLTVRNQRLRKVKPLAGLGADQPKSRPDCTARALSVPCAAAQRLHHHQHQQHHRHFCSRQVREMKGRAEEGRQHTVRPGAGSLRPGSEHPRGHWELLPLPHSVPPAARLLGAFPSFSPTSTQRHFRAVPFLRKRQQ